MVPRFYYRALRKKLFATLVWRGSALFQFNQLNWKAAYFHKPQVRGIVRWFLRAIISRTWFFIERHISMNLSRNFLFPFARCSRNMSTACCKSDSNALSSSRSSSRSAKWSSSAAAASILASSSESSETSEPSSSSDNTVSSPWFSLGWNSGRRTSCGCIQNGEVLDLVTLLKKNPFDSELVTSDYVLAD